MKHSICKIILSLIVVILFTACKKPDPIVEEKTGKIKFEFLHYYDGEPVMYDSLMYVNPAGNELMINEIQYFISDVSLFHEDNSTKIINDWTDIYYIDKDIPATLTWNVYDDIPVGNYEKLTFIFGIPAAKNIPYMYVNPPERDMFWPSFLGGANGGYHYMKLNGKWREMPEDQISPFDFHLGVGQEYASGVVSVDSIIGFYQNYFTITLNQTYTIEEDKTTIITIVMNIEEWFKNPNVFDFEVWGGYIMQNQDAMEIACQNGADVFEVQKVETQ